MLEERRALGKINLRRVGKWQRRAHDRRDDPPLDHGQQGILGRGEQ